MSTGRVTNQSALVSPESRIAAMHQEASDLALAVESKRQQALAQTNARIEGLEKKASDLAWSVEFTRQQTLLQADKKTEALEQKALALAHFVETLRDQTRDRSETEIETLGQNARDLAICVENVRKETRAQTELAIEALDRKAHDLAVSVETVRQEAQLHANAEINELKHDALVLAVSVEESRIAALMESNRATLRHNEELERRVLERTSQLEAANKELESFSYSVSHDLRAPLRAIDGFSRIVLEDFAGPLAEEGKAYLRLVRDNTRQMGRLVDDLLAFSRLGRLSLSKQTVDPARIVRACLAEMNKDMEGRNLEVKIDALPPCQADATLLKQVWLNLLSNALKYSRKREAARIEVGCRMETRTATTSQRTLPGEVAVYFVKDNGAGFDMKYASKLFGVFQRLHRAADFEGTGVGLAIVQRIVNRHGGQVTAHGEVDKGAVFSFTLE